LCFCRSDSLLFATNLLFWIQIRHKMDVAHPARVHEVNP